MKARALTGHPMTLVSSAAELDAALFRLAAVSPVYQPAGPAPDDPADWRLLPAHVFAPHRCGCGARFHVRRHRDAHEHTCPYGRI